jgi:hypothetical protein
MLAAKILRLGLQPLIQMTIDAFDQSNSKQEYWDVV